ncbi:putative ribonuclease H-like domain-containing protein [Tanacetum coccineum]
MDQQVVQDYALWEVIENGNSWVSVPQTTQENGTSVTKMSVHVTAEEKANKKNDVNARSLLLMALSNEHQLIFSQHTDAKTILPIEWNTHVVVWMNKAEIETMSIDDLYNNFKILEQSVKKSVGTSGGAQNLAFMTAPSTSSTNDINTTKPAYEVSTASPNVNTASPQVTTATFSDNAVYAFMVENPNGSNLLQQDFDQIHEDDLEAMDLKWQLSLLSMRAKRYYHRTDKKIFINDTVGYDKSKVECFNCHKMGHFAKKYRGSRIKEGFDWSEMAEEQKQYDDLIVKFNQTEFTTATYKRGLPTLEEQLITYRKNEVLFSEEVLVLKREVACKDYEINMLKSEFEKVKQEKEGIEFKIEKFDKASKDLNQLLESQITNKRKKGLGYNTVPPPHPLIYNRPKKLDLSYSDASKDNFDGSLVKGQALEDSFVESSLNNHKETVFPDKKKESVKPKNHEKPVKKSVRHMTGNISYLLDFKEFDGGYVTFGRGAHGGRISGKRTLKIDSLDFEDVYFVNELKFNLFSVSQMCDKKNYVLFTDSECLVLSPNFKLPDESQILLKIPRKDNMYSFDMNNIVPKESLTCHVAKEDYLQNVLKMTKPVLLVLKGSNTELLIEGIRREYSVARTPQQNGVAERRNRTLIETARTMLADSKLPTTFWAKAISTAYYKKTCIMGFLENKPMIKENGPKWLFDIDSLTQSMNYVPVVAGTFINESAGTQGELNASTSTQKEDISQDCVVMPIWKDASYFDSSSKDVGTGEPKFVADDQKQIEDDLDNENDEKDKSEDDSSPKEVNTARQHVNTASPEVNTSSFKLHTVDPSVNTASSNDQDSPKDIFTMGASHTLEATHVEFFSDEDEPEVDLGNILTSYTVPTTPNTRIHKHHPIKNAIGDIEPTSIAKALSDSSWVEAMQEELLQFKLQQVWILMDLPFGKRSIGTKWVFRNKKDKRGIVIRNKARFVAQGHRQEEGIDYDKVFAPVARIEAIRLFLAYASFMGFLVYQMDMKSAFLYGTIKEVVYVTQSPGFKDPDHPDKVYKVVKALYVLHQAPRAWYETLANYLLDNGFKRGKIDQTLFIKKQKGDILLVQDKYVDEILKKFNYTNVKSGSTPVDLEKPLVKDGDANDVDVHLYRSMIRSLMYLTTSRPDIIYLKGNPTLDLLYSRDSPFELVAYTDIDYAGATQDRKSTIGDLLTKGFDAGRFQYLVSSIGMLNP